MRHRIPTAALAALAATMILAGTALAGGWANAVMDEPPPSDPPSAGEPITIGFTLLQHGVTPVNDPAPTVTVRNATGEELSVIATQEGASGHWVAVITFPSDGTWRYEVTHELIVGMNGFNPVTVGSVAPAAPAASTATSAVAAQPLATLVLALLLTLAIAAAFILSRRRADRYRTVRA